MFIRLMILILLSTSQSSIAQTNETYISDPQKTALVLIEYQNEWISEKGWLRQHLVKDEKQFKDAIAMSKKVLEQARQKKLKIIHVTLTPDSQYRIFGTADFGLRHAIPKVGTWQGEANNIHPDFRPQPEEHVIRERTGASAFAGSNLDSYLRNNHISTLILIGFATHVCVESTLRESHDLGYRTFVITDATGAFTSTQKHYFSENIIHHFGKEIQLSDL